jgi:CBS domain containing-hemolysin-like protein
MLGVLAVLAFIALNGFFVAAEFALVKLRATNTRSPNSDPKLEEAIHQIGRYLSVTQIGITLASLGLGWIGEPALVHLAQDMAHKATGHEMHAGAETALKVVAFSLLTYGHVLLGELVPKLIAIQHSQKIALMSLLPLNILFWVLRLPLFILENSSKIILNMFNMNIDTHGEAALSEDEILGILTVYVAQGKGGAEKHDIFQRVMRFSQRTAKQAMVPRMDVEYLPVTSNGAEAIASFYENHYSRVVLSQNEKLDEVVGYLYWKDLLSSPEREKLTNLESLRREALFVPESQSLVSVLKDMQKAQTPFAVVTDEYGGTSGILTMEDLLEEIVGEIQDELDEETVRIECHGDVWEVDGGVVVDELDEVGLKIPEEEKKHTVGALVLERLKRLPKVGDVVDMGGVEAEVIAADHRRVTRVRLRPNEEAR